MFDNIEKKMVMAETNKKDLIMLTSLLIQHGAINYITQNNDTDSFINKVKEDYILYKEGDMGMSEESFLSLTAVLFQDAVDHPKDSDFMDYLCNYAEEIVDNMGKK